MVNKANPTIESFQFAPARGRGNPSFAISSADNDPVPLFSMTNQGRLGVNTITPSANLDVNGTAKISETLAVSGKVTLSTQLDNAAGSISSPQINGVGGTTGIYWPESATGKSMGFATGSKNIFVVKGVDSGINYLSVQQAVANSGPNLNAEGEDTNIDINLVAKGSGSLKTKSIIANIYSSNAPTQVVASSNTTLDFSSSNTFKISLSTTITNLTFINNTTTGTYIIFITQQGGGNNITNYPSNLKWKDGLKPNISSDNNKIDILTIVCDGTNNYASISQGY